MTSPDAEIAKSRREVLDRHPSPEVEVIRSNIGSMFCPTREFRYKIVFRCNRIFETAGDAKDAGRSALLQIEEALRCGK